MGLWHCVAWFHFLAGGREMSLGIPGAASRCHTVAVLITIDAEPRQSISSLLFSPREPRSNAGVMYAASSIETVVRSPRFIHQVSSVTKSKLIFSLALAWLFYETRGRLFTTPHIHAFTHSYCTVHASNRYATSPITTLETRTNSVECRVVCMYE